MTNYEKLINTLKEVFMLDKAELDFGIYRIMNQKRKDIEQFLEVDLVPQVQKVLGESLSIDKQAIQKELDEAIKSAQALGADPDSLPKVQKLKVRLGEAADLVGLENEVFSLLANFFRRYFDNGDFISMRRYKKDVYSIPYEGEEVKLHWANADQYYIKTSEYFKNYRFKLNNGKSVVFELIEASTEQNNNKTQGDQERRFALYTENPCEQVGDEFKIYFTYEPTDKKEKQSDLLNEVFDTVKTRIPQDFLDLLSLRPTEKDKQRTLLQKHLLDYTARNTFDYFIHKDLDGFLTRELDFYIKNEVLFIDDLNTRDEQEFLKQLSKIKAIKKIGEKIITFLAQIENFQKKLWLKKKMVVECNYCITLDRVPEELYPEIATNQKQIDEWVRLFAIDEIKDAPKPKEEPKQVKIEFAVAEPPTNYQLKKGFSNPLTIEFIKQNPFLVLDTAFFSESFKWYLISSIESFDEQCDGLLINSENFQALNLLMNRYKGQIKCTYNDPPYNTGNDGFPYKDSYQHSSWMTFINDRMSLLYEFLNESGSFMMSIDEIEETNAKTIFNNVFGKSNFVTDIIWEGSSKNDQKYISISHEYILVGLKNKEFLDNSNIRWLEKKEGLDDIYSAFEKIRELHPDDYDEQSKELKKFYKNLPVDHPGRLSAHYNCVEKRGIYFPDNISKPAKGYYYDVIHPITKKPCKKPKGGWRFIEETMKEQLKEDLIHFGRDESTVPCRKSFLNETEYMSPRSVVYQDNRVATKLNKELFNDKDIFQNPKYYLLLSKYFKLVANKSDIFLDVFAGSGTTAHSIIYLNNSDKGSRKYILAEMGTYFNTVTKPRILKVVYSKDWKDGKPISREGISQCFKYMRLEGYEDTLNNLEIKRSDTQQKVLEMNPSFKEGYMLNYMLDVETQGSLLNLDWFENPFNCYLNVTRNNELQPTKVDLVETFNYLIGLVVEHYAVPKEGYVVVTGKNLASESILVVWRDCTRHNSVSLNEFLSKSKYNPLDNEFDRIYVNGDNNVENLKIGDERWKVVLIEEEFKTRMFEN